jgi:hypothetical protein
MPASLTVMTAMTAMTVDGAYSSVPPALADGPPGRATCFRPVEKLRPTPYFQHYAIALHDIALPNIASLIFQKNARNEASPHDRA